MKRINISYGFMIIFGDLFRPSKHSEITNALHSAGIYTIREACAMSEKDFRKFPFATDYMFKKVQAQLARYGLSFSMSEEELDAYQDAEYLQNNPDENEAPVVDAPQEKMTCEGIHEEEVDKADLMFKEAMSLFKNVNHYREDAIELMARIKKFHDQERVYKTLKESYFKQPWWKKMFGSKAERLYSAMMDTLLICGSAETVSGFVDRGKKELAEKFNNQ